MSNSRDKFDDEKEDDNGGLIQLIETMKTFLEAALSGTMTNTDCKSELKR